MHVYIIYIYIYIYIYTYVYIYIYTYVYIYIYIDVYYIVCIYIYIYIQLYVYITIILIIYLPVLHILSCLSGSLPLPTPPLRMPHSLSREHSAVTAGSRCMLTNCEHMINHLTNVRNLIHTTTTRSHGL